MNGKRFLDSNILVYAYDKDEPVKQAVAQDALKQGIEEENLVISVQVLGEFFNAVTRRIAQPMSPEEAREAIRCVGALPVVDLEYPMVDRAIEIHEQYQLSYWDGMIIAAAERAGCPQVLSEDLSNGQRYAGVLVFNPFVESLDAPPSRQGN